MHGWQKIVFNEAALLLFPETFQIVFVYEKLLLESFFAVISSQNFKIYTEVAPLKNLFAF